MIKKKPMPGLASLCKTALRVTCSESTIQTTLQCDGSQARVIDMCRQAVFGADTSIAVEVEVLS